MTHIHLEIVSITIFFSRALCQQFQALNQYICFNCGDIENSIFTTCRIASPVPRAHFRSYVTGSIRGRSQSHFGWLSHSKSASSFRSLPQLLLKYQFNAI